MICGAVNFTVGDRVPLALPGSVLPGGVEIGARQAYGRMSEGMICSAAELGFGDDHSGILVLPSDAPLGADFAEYAGLRDHVLDINVTPDKGFALSIRGVARELAIAFEVEFTDPAGVGLPADVPRGIARSCILSVCGTARPRSRRGRFQHHRLPAAHRQARSVESRFLAAEDRGVSAGVEEHPPCSLG